MALLPFALFAALVFVYLVSRLVFLTRMPAFLDEAIHIQLARDTLHGQLKAGLGAGRFLPVKVIALCQLLPFDALFSARLASVVCGLSILLTCVLIGRELFSWQEGLLAGFIYAVLPFTVVNDRMALTDNYLTACGAWFLFLSIFLTKHGGLKYSLAACAFLCTAILAKVTGVLFFAIPLLACVFLVEGKSRIAYLRRCMPALICGFALLMLLTWRGFGVPMVGKLCASEDTARLDLILRNVGLACQWLTFLLTPVIALLAVVAVLWALCGIFGKAKAEAFLALLLLVVLVPYVLAGNRWYPRYFFFSMVPISLLLGRAIVVFVSSASRLASKLAPRLAIHANAVLFTIVVFVLAAACVPVDLPIITSPENAAVPPADRIQHISGWAAGYGLPEASAFLRGEAEKGEINVARFDARGPANDGLNVYLNATKSLHMYTLNGREPNVAAEALGLAKSRRTLFVSNPAEEQMRGIARRACLGNATRIWVYDRPGSESQLEIWELPRFRAGK